MNSIQWIVIAGFLALGLALPVAADESVVVRVLQKSGEPLQNALVLLDVTEASEAEPSTYVMDQVDMAFNPHVLVVPKGAPVAFPNSDPVGHHVYSFSRPNQFVLPLYRGTSPDPITFDHPGVVVLGCNIHDNMIGYIVVTENQVHGWTDEEGRIELGPRSAELAQNVHVWSPRLSTRKEQLSYAVTDGVVEIQLQHKLKRATSQSAKFAQY